jgi:hypothetical protein
MRLLLQLAGKKSPLKAGNKKAALFERLSFGRDVTSPTKVILSANSAGLFFYPARGIMA